MRTFEGRAARSWVRSLAWLPDGSGLVAGGNNGGIGLWDLGTGRPRWERKWGGAANEIILTPDGQRGISASTSCARVWALADGQIIRQLDHYPLKEINELALHPDGRLMAGASGTSTFEHHSGHVAVWDLRTFKLCGMIEVRGGVWSAAFRPGGGTIAVGSGRAGIVIWDISEQARPHPVRPAPAATLGGSEAGFLELDGFRRIATEVGARQVRYTADGQMLVAAAGWSILVFDAATGRPVALGKGHRANIESIDLASDGATVASAAHDGTVRLWDVATGEQRACYDCQIGPVDAVRFAPDGMTLAVGGKGGVVLVDVEAP